MAQVPMTQALKTLHDKVEARTASYSDFSNYFKPVLTDTEHVHWGTIAKSADSGSLDAAKALMDAVLPGWVISIGTENNGEFHVIVGSVSDTSNYAEAFNANLARAWLLAIIRALLSQAEGE
ncbi:hypothetical protein [uncultured Ruegeria sp.]|uniref:hypothetical protein n=1 Tax=uncultured Ruegeria sp. TaxID=259304 RepID=UPI00263A13FB|nr:hypothetical protein [uncultured Ruegeria sp.]